MLSNHQHYRAYQPKPLTKQEIDNVEVLFGGLHWRAERVLQALFENLGYRARPLPAATRADLLLGRELADIGQCCPTSFTTGGPARRAWFAKGQCANPSEPNPKTKKARIGFPSGTP